MQFHFDVTRHSKPSFWLLLLPRYSPCVVSALSINNSSTLQVLRTKTLLHYTDSCVSLSSLHEHPICANLTISHFLCYCPYVSRGLLQYLYMYLLETESCCIA